MTGFAHAGHWLAQLLYVAPVIAMIAAILWAKVRARGYGEDDGPNSNQR